MPAAGARWRAHTRTWVIQGGLSATLGAVGAEERPELNFIVGSLYDSGFVEVTTIKRRVRCNGSARLLNWAGLMPEYTQLLLLEWKTRLSAICRRGCSGTSWRLRGVMPMRRLVRSYYSGTQVRLITLGRLNSNDRAAKMGQSLALLKPLYWMYTNGRICRHGLPEGSGVAQGRGASFADDPISE